MRAFSVVTTVLTIVGLASRLHAEMANVVDPLSISGTVNGTFVNPLPADTTFSGVGTNFFTYGESLGTPNQLTIAGSSLSTDTNSDFTLGRLTYFNGGTFGGTTAGTVQLDLAVTLTAPISTSLTLPMTLELLSTENATGGADPDADYVSASLATTTIFSVNGVAYQLEFLGFGNLGGSGSLFDPHTLRLGEELSTTADIMAVVMPVPEPSSIVLLGAALCLAGFSRLRKRKAATTSINNGATD
jgi:hypothetical protein